MASYAGAAGPAAAGAAGAQVTIAKYIGEADRLDDFMDDLRLRATVVTCLQVSAMQDVYNKLETALNDVKMPRLRSIKIYLRSFKALVRNCPSLEEVTLDSGDTLQPYLAQLADLVPLTRLVKVDMGRFHVNPLDLEKLLTKTQSRICLKTLVIGKDDMAMRPNVEPEVHAINATRAPVDRLEIVQV